MTMPTRKYKGKESVPNITIIDAIMGLGKTTYIINEIINKHPEKKYLCVVPTIDKLDKKEKIIKEGEVGRYLREIGVDAYEPQTSPSKTKDLQRLIYRNQNIVTTHSLIANVDEVTMDLLKKRKYTLIIDECLDTVHEYGKNGKKCSKSDVKTLLHDEWVIPDDRGFLRWNEEKEKSMFNNMYEGRWSDIRRLCHLHALMCLPRPGGKFSNSILIWNLPVEFFTLFPKCYICTYLWNGSFQKSYFDMHNIKYQHMTLNNGQLEKYDPEKELSMRKEYYSLINLCKDTKLNSIGTPDKRNKYPLCKEWYKKAHKQHPLYLNRIQNNTINYFKNIVKTNSKQNMFTVFKDFRKYIKGEGYTKGFVYCSCKGTNDYRHKESLAYLINLLPPENLIRFFASQGIDFDRDSYSLAELIQWIWRSQIRDKKPINLYMPSQRMRELLEDWALGRI